ncbi:hypothetical protein BJX61DRAFT_521347 [Aspergillus egyptiacus]|nr:hypothetical protein BJX61DRAFT_521347 [Aspergillus egyptiacus]
MMSLVMLLGETSPLERQISQPLTSIPIMNWTGGRLRRHSEANGKTRKQTFGKSGASKGPHQFTLFQNFVRQNGDEKSEKPRNSVIQSAVPEVKSRGTSSQAQSHSNSAAAQGTSRQTDRLERMKRQLLETEDEKDHERLKTSTMIRPRAREVIPSEGESPENLEIRINGERLGHGNAGLDEANMNEAPANLVSSQSMLLDVESASSGPRAVSDSLPSKSSAGRSTSMLSMNDSQLCYLSDVPTASDPASDFCRIDTSDPMDWVSDEPTPGVLQSNESSLTVPQPESPVRRRFTIDEQVLADEKGNFMMSSPWAEPLTTFSYKPCSENCRGFCQESSSLMMAGSHRRRHGIASRTSSPLAFNWPSPQYQGTEHTDSNRHANSRNKTHSQESQASPTQSGGGQEQPTVTIYGQPVALTAENGRGEGLWPEQSDVYMDLGPARTSFSPFRWG